MEDTNPETLPSKMPSRKKKPVQLSPEQEQKILSWLAEGMDAKSVALLFEQETGSATDTASVIALWQKHAARLHLERRNYFAKLASGLVDGAFAGEQALDAANAYLLKQALFECLIDPQKDPRQIELLVKAMKAVTPEKTAESDAARNQSEGLSEETLQRIEEMAKIL